jgi:hypothetical protein
MIAVYRAVSSGARDAGKKPMSSHQQIVSLAGGSPGGVRKLIAAYETGILLRAANSQKRRVKRKHSSPFVLVPSGNNYDPLALIEPLSDLFAGTRYVAAVSAVYKDGAHIADDPAGERPFVDLGLCDKNAINNCSQCRDVGVAGVICYEKKRGLWRCADYLDLHTRDHDKALRPGIEHRLPPIYSIGNKNPQDEPDRIDAQRRGNKKYSSYSRPDISHDSPGPFSMRLKLYLIKNRIGMDLPLLSAGRQFMDRTAVSTESSNP